MNVKSENDKNQYHTLLRFNMVEEKLINNLILEPILSADGMEIITYNIKKIRKTNRKADPMINEKSFDKSYISDEIVQKTKNIGKSKDTFERRKNKKRNKKETQKDNSPKEDTRPWYSKYFWVLAIGGMIGYNIMTFDKEKLKDAMEQANRQQNGTQARN